VSYIYTTLPFDSRVNVSWPLFAPDLPCFFFWLQVWWDLMPSGSMGDAEGAEGDASAAKSETAAEGEAGDAEPKDDEEALLEASDE
jgi:hypothetical protein